MQERAAALYIALFLVLAAGSYVMVGAAEAPTFAYDDPDYELTAGDEFELDGVTYTVDSIDEVDGEQQATVVWDEQIDEEAELADGDEVDQNNETWVVQLPDDGTTFTLREALDEDVRTVEEDGELYVVVEEDGQDVLVHIDDYDEIDRQEYTEGDTFVYQETDTNIESVSNESVLLTWTDTQESEAALTHGSQWVPGEQAYMAVFDGSTVQLSTDIDAYLEFQDGMMDQYTDRVNGLWGIFNLSLIGIFLIGALAFLPHRE